MVPYPNWITINLDHLVSNIKYLQSLTPNGCKFLFPVKADAYGHGSLACSWAATYADIDALGVAHLFEGVSLREHGSEQEILVLGPLTEGDFQTCLKYQLTPTLTRLDTAIAFEKFLKAKSVCHRVHIKVDTGMGRYGFAYDDPTPINAILNFDHIQVDGLYSHFACAEDIHHPLNLAQLSRFESLKSKLNSLPGIIHFANSAGVFNYPESHLDMIRPGLSVYGYQSVLNPKIPHDLRPVMQIEATVREIKTIHEGEGVSYGQTWVAAKDTLVACVSIGYGDGFRRGLTPQTEVFIKGQACQVLGTVCMDTIIVDLSMLEFIPPIGSSVNIIDGMLSHTLSVETMAQRMNISSYELTCGVARRLKRKYVWRGRLLVWDELKVQLGIINI